MEAGQYRASPRVPSTRRGSALFMTNSSSVARFTVSLPPRRLRAECVHRSAMLLLVVGALAAAGCSATNAASLSPSADDVVVSDARVGGALATSCYECHSNRGGAPWHAKLAPSYWFAGSARKALNFSNWQQYNAQQRSDELAAIAKAVNDGDMPPWDYKLFHPSIGLSAENRAAVVKWASQPAAEPAH